MSFELKHEGEQFLFDHWPGYSTLVSFSNMGHHYRECDHTVDEYDSNDGESIDTPELSSAGVTSSESTSFDDTFAEGSSRSFLLFGDDEHDWPLEDSDDDSILSSDLPTEGTIPISLWYDDSIHSYDSDEEEEDDEIHTPVDDDSEQDTWKELRETLSKLIPPPPEPIEILVSESLAPLEEPLRLSPMDCFADVCWASHQNFLDVPRLVSGRRAIDVPEEVYEVDEDQLSISIPSPMDDISFSPSPTSKSPSSFKRFAQRIRNNSFGRKRISA